MLVGKAELLIKILFKRNKYLKIEYTMHIPDLIIKLFVFRFLYRGYFPYGAQNGFRSLQERWKEQRI